MAKDNIEKVIKIFSCNFVLHVTGLPRLTFSRDLMDELASYTGLAPCYLYLGQLVQHPVQLTLPL
jgi:hypothetical protein